MALINEIGGMNSNSYISVIEADEYFLYRPNADAWNELAENDKSKYLIFACSQLDTLVFYGERKDELQSLRLPTVFIPNIPLKVKQAQCEQALYLIENPEIMDYASKQALGINSNSFGKTSMGFNGSFSLISPMALNLCKSYLAKYQGVKVI